MQSKEPMSKHYLVQIDNEQVELPFSVYKQVYDAGFHHIKYKCVDWRKNKISYLICIDQNYLSNDELERFNKFTIQIIDNYE